MIQASAFSSEQRAQVLSFSFLFFLVDEGGGERFQAQQRQSQVLNSLKSTFQTTLINVLLTVIMVSFPYSQCF